MIHIDLDACSGFGSKERIIHAQEILNRILSSPEFKQACLDHNFQETQDTAERVYNTMQTDITVGLSRYRTWRWWSRVVGYVLGRGSKTIHCNAKYWDIASPVDNASFILHESSHILGYTHSSASAKQSVPYSMNEIAKEVAEELKLGPCTLLNSCSA